MFLTLKFLYWTHFERKSRPPKSKHLPTPICNTHEEMHKASIKTLVLDIIINYDTLIARFGNGVITAMHNYVSQLPAS